MIKIAAVYRPGKARTGVTSYAEILKTALAGFAEIEFFKSAPKSGFDLIHIIDIKHASAADVLHKQVPVIADLHDYYWSEHRYFPGPDALARWFLQTKRKKRYLNILNAADAVIVHSRTVGQCLERKNVYLVPIAIDFEKFGAGASKEREPLIILVGRDSWRKGLGTLIGALKIIAADFPELKVEVIGKEYLHTRVWAKIKSIRLDLKFTGELGSDELIKKYQRAMIVYLGSWQEGFGLSLVEGMAAGCIAIGSTAGGIPEVVEDGVSGILFHPGDQLELSAKIRALLETDELRQKFAAMGQRRVRELFTIDKMRASLVQAYEGVLKGGR